MSNEYLDWLADRTSFWKNEDKIKAFHKDYLSLCKKYGYEFAFNSSDALYLEEYSGDEYDSEVMENLEETMAYWRIKR